MSRRLIESLKRLTPDASGLDRDALLFAAGRASAPSPARAWVLVGLLALSQALTAGLLLTPPASAPIPPVPDRGYPAAITDTQAPQPWPTASEQILPAERMIPDEPPLRLMDRELFVSSP